MLFPSLGPNIDFQALCPILHIRTILLIWGQSKRLSVSHYEKYKEQLSLQTMAIGNLVLVLTNGKKTLVID